MEGSRVTRFIVAIIILVAGAAALFFLFRLILGGNDTPREAQNTSAPTLAQHADSRAIASLTMNGAIVGREDHRSVRITISQNRRMVEVLQGYGDEVIRRREYPNTQSAYEAFLRALDYQGFTREQSSEFPIERGVCPNGIQYIYGLENAGSDSQRLWSVSCGRGIGTMAGQTGDIGELFRDQIPDYGKLTSDVRLR